MIVPREARRERDRVKYHQRKARGECPGCGKSKTASWRFSYCQACRERFALKYEKKKTRNTLQIQWEDEHQAVHPLDGEKHRQLIGMLNGLMLDLGAEVLRIHRITGRV